MISDGRSAIDVARGYAACGWSPIPVPSRSKIPVVEGWEQLRIASADVPQHFRPGSNIGVLLGEPSGNLVDVDLDHPLAVELADQFLPPTDCEFGRASKPRSHRLYRVFDQTPTKKRQTKTHGMLVELRSTGTQTVFPGSIHEKGEPIEWAVNGEPLSVSGQELTNAVNALADEIERRLGVVKGACPAQQGQASVVERARKYLAKLPPAISGQGGHNATLEAAAILFRFGLDDRDAAALMDEFNERCQPQWSPREIEHKLTDAKRLVVDAGEFGKLARNGKPAKRPRKPRAIAIESRSGKGQQRNLPDGTPDLAADDGRTDHANARRFAAMFGERVRWCEQLGKWLIWDGRRWAADHQRKTEGLAKNVADAIWAWAGEHLSELNRDTAEQLVQFGRYTSSARGMTNMLALTRSEPGIPVSSDQLDADPWLLNFRNGTVDLNTGRLRQHNRTDCLTKVCDLDFDLEATCPQWLSVLHRIMAGDQGLIRYLQQLAGVSLVGKTIEHILPFCYGKGANGKSLFLGTLLDCLGPDYGMKAAPDLLVVKKGETHPTERAALLGKRVIACIETEDGRRLAEGLVKELTGGDKITARFMRQDFFEFAPSHTVWLAANHKPVIRGTDHGIWRRVKLVPFTVTIPENEQDKRLPDKLRAEFCGILSWMVRGCMDWLANGLLEPEAVKTATGGYRAEMDLIGLFISERTLEGNAFKVKASELYRCYCEWCKSTNEHPQPQRRFGQAMTDRGFERKTNNGVWYEGIGLMGTEGTEGTEVDF